MKHPNIILAITDCLRYDAFLNMRVIKEAEKIHKQAYTAAPNTFFSVPAIMTGTFPFSFIDDAKIKHSIISYLPLVASLLGYEIIFITGNVVTSRAFGYYVPKDNYIEDFITSRKDMPELKQDEKNKKTLGTMFPNFKNKLKKEHPKMFRKIKAVYDQLRWFTTGKKRADQNTNFEYKIRGNDINEILYKILQENTNNPKFIFLHYMDTHAPYGNPNLSKSQFRNAELLMKKLYHFPYYRLKHREIENIKELYSGEVEYLDLKLLELLEMIGNHLGFENTLLTIMSDHGEAFGEEGYFVHPSNALIKEVLHVPLAFYGDVARKINGRYESLFSSYRIYDIFYQLIRGKSEIKLKTSDEILAVGYERIPDSKMYKPNELCIIRNSDLIRKDLNDEFTKTMFETKIAEDKKEYLKRKIDLFKIK